MPIYRKSMLVFLVVAFIMVGGGMYSYYAAQADSIVLSKGVNEDNQPKGQIVVYVSGGVTHAGVVTLMDGTRVIDAVEACGGVLPNADTTKINMAKALKDGEQIQVPIRENLVAEQLPASESAKQTTNGKSSKKSSGGLVNINTADKAELDSLPGVGPSTAEAILEYRNQVGNFQTTEEVKKVRGIGEAKYKKMADRITI